jgi:hypothetical protein
MSGRPLCDGSAFFTLSATPLELENVCTPDGHVERAEGDHTR